jgi:hypothetical protein
MALDQHIGVRITAGSRFKINELARSDFPEKQSHNKKS